MMPPFLPPLMLGSIEYKAVGGSSSGVEDDPADAIVTLRYDSDGGVRHSQSFVSGSNTTDLGEWSSLHPNETDGASWSVRVSFSSGTNQYSSGSGLATWLTLNVNRTWTFLKDGVGMNSGTYTVEISNDGGSTIYSSTSYTVTLTVQTP